MQTSILAVSSATYTIDVRVVLGMGQLVEQSRLKALRLTQKVLARAIKLPIYLLYV